MFVTGKSNGGPKGQKRKSFFAFGKNHKHSKLFAWIINFSTGPNSNPSQQITRQGLTAGPETDSNTSPATAAADHHHPLRSGRCHTGWQLVRVPPARVSESLGWGRGPKAETHKQCVWLVFVVSPPGTWMDPWCSLISVRFVSSGRFFVVAAPGPRTALLIS